MKRNRTRPEDYNIGWISALSLELSAAQLVLDEEHESIAEAAQYTLGRIGAHNVVQACLPAGQYGTNSAAVTAAELRSKFPNILYWLMVGIGGGVPSSGVDIRLGDVVICKPQNRHGGVVQYDLGKIGPNGEHVRTGLLNAPPMALGTAVSKMQSVHDVGKSKVQSYLSAFSHLRRFHRGPPQSDVLFESDYQHNGEPSCARCLPERAISRAPRPNQDPVVHFGLIASGNQIIKDGITRDTLSAELGGVLCFEMEAAGLVNNFPCLVIRGICDYADSHKSKQWQYFAAASAAACAKEILSCVPCSSSTSQENPGAPQCSDISLEHTVSQGSRTETPPLRTQDTPISSASMRTDARYVDLPVPDDLRRQYFDSLRFNNINVRHATIRTAHAKTCRWILRRTPYLNWLNGQCLEQHHGFFWIKGKPGAGKSTLMKFILANTSKTSSPSLVLSFFFNARGVHLEKSTLGMYQSILYQLLEKTPNLQDVLTLHPPQQDEAGNFSWEIDNLKVAFENAIVQLQNKPVMLFIDALDECDEYEIRDMVSFFEYLGDIAVEGGLNFRVCFSSRHYPHVTIDRCIELILEEQDEHKHDIEQYLHTELKAGQSKFANDIRSEILHRASGIFLWVVLVVQILNTELARGNKHTMKKRLQEIPDGLERLFGDILTRDNHNTEQLVLCLQWVLFSQQPLKIEELYCGILSATDPSAVVPWKSDEVDFEDMRRFVVNNSKGLVEETKLKHRHVQFIHESVRDYFLKGTTFNTALFGPFETFEARSHDTLKLCCFNYCTEVAKIKKALAEEFRSPVAKESQHAHPRQISPTTPFMNDIFAHAYAAPCYPATKLSVGRVQGRAALPFIEYAVPFVWDHCDKSHGLGIPQDLFIQNLSLSDWVPLNNALESSDRHQLPEDVDLLYIFAKRGLSSLIKHELSRAQSIDLWCGGYGFPLRAAARGAKSEAVTRELLTFHLRNRPDISSLEIDRIVAVLLKDRTPLLQSDRSMLHWASRVPDIGLWKALLPNGIVTNSVARSHGKRLLAHACEFGFTEMARSLLERGARPSAVDQSGCPALSLASQNRHLNVVRLLLEYGADANEWGGGTGRQLPLIAASVVGDVDVAGLLLAYNADWDRYCKGWSALTIAAAKGQYEIWELLLGEPSMVLGGRHRSGPITTALPFAIESGHIELVRHGIVRIADNIRLGQFCRTNLWKAVDSSSTHRLEMVQLLLSHITDTSSLGQDGFLAIRAAAKTPQILELLLEHNIDIDTTGNDGESSLLACVRNGTYEEVKNLVRFGSDIRLKDAKGTTPWLAAYYRVVPDIKKLFQEHMDGTKHNDEHTE